MDIKVTFGEGMEVLAHFKEYTVKTDQSVQSGGQGSAPDPFSLFLSGLACCSGFFVSRFCQLRKIPTDGIQLMLTHDMNEDEHLIENIKIEIQLPANFPQKYIKALVRATDHCSVKRALMNPPHIEVTSVIMDESTAVEPETTQAAA